MRQAVAENRRSESLYQLEGNAQPFRAYTPQRALVGESQFRHVCPDVRIPLESSGNVEFYWRLPPGAVSAVALDDPYEPQRAFRLFPADAEIRLRFDYSTRPGSEGVTLVSIQGWLQNAAFLDVDDIRLRGVPEFPLQPRFGCPVSGPYHLTVTANGGKILDEDYFQRGLQFEANPALLDLTRPVEMSFWWDYGGSAIGGSHPTWRVDASPLPAPWNGSSSHIKFWWDLYQPDREHSAGLDITAAADAYPLVGLESYVRYEDLAGKPDKALLLCSRPSVSSFAPAANEAVYVRSFLHTIGGSGTEARWSARVLDGYEKEVLALASAGESLTWDGRDQAGRFVPPGPYKLVVQARVGDLEVTDQFDLTVSEPAVRIIGLKTEPPEIGPVRVSAEGAWSGTGPPPPCQWRIEVLGPKSKTEPVFAADSAPDAPLRFEATWNPADKGPPDRGVYKIVASVASATSPKACRELLLLLDKPGHQHTVGIFNLAVHPLPLELETQHPDETGATVSADILQVGFSQATPSVWTLRLVTGQGETLRTLSGRVTLEAAPDTRTQQSIHWETFWDGRDEQDVVVPNGSYFFRLTVDPHPDDPDQESED